MQQPPRIQASVARESLFDQAGGEKAIRGVIESLVGSMVDDVMIGFFFRRTSLDRLQELEYQYAAAFLGAQTPYLGRPLARTHRRLNISGGQFARRRQLLLEAMGAHDVPDAVQAAWLAHTDALRPAITRESDTTCHGRSSRESGL